jgi:hypothetical protein
MTNFSRLIGDEPINKETVFLDVHKHGVDLSVPSVSTYQQEPDDGFNHGHFSSLLREP